MVWAIGTYDGANTYTKTMKDRFNYIRIRLQVTEWSAYHNRCLLVVQISQMIDQNTDWGNHNIYSHFFEYFQTQVSSGRHGHCLTFHC